MSVAPRAVTFMLCFALAATVAMNGVFRASENPGRERPKLKLDALQKFAEKIDLLPSPAVREGDPRVRVAFLGDSMLFARRQLDALPFRLQALASQGANGGAPVAVYELAIPGSSAFDFYFVTDEILAKQPGLVIVEFNLTSLSDIWRNEFARPQLAGLLSLRRVPEALGLPLYWTGLTADRMFTYIGLIRIGALDPWTQLELSQTTSSNGPDRLARWIESSIGFSAAERFNGLRFFRSVRRDPGTARFAADRELERFGAALSGVGPEHPVLRALSAMVHDFTRAGIPIYVYANPLNVDNLERVEILDRESLDVSLSSIKEVVEAAGGRFSDFHDLLPDAGFSDPAGHLSHEGRGDGTYVLARALSKVVREEVARIVSRR